MRQASSPQNQLVSLPLFSDLLDLGRVSLCISLRLERVGLPPKMEAWSDPTHETKASHLFIP